VNTESGVNTWDVLKDFGFGPDPNEDRQHGSGGLYYDFGNVKLRASLQFYLGPIVLFTLTWRKNPMGPDEFLLETDFRLPPCVNSREFCAACIADKLDKMFSGEKNALVSAAGVPRWLEMGRLNQHVLPWKRVVVEHHCWVPHEWARLALKTLKEDLAEVSEDTPIVFGFDGKVFTLQCDEKVVATPGEGWGPWERRYAVEARYLRRLPKRLASGDALFYFRDSDFFINKWGYIGVAAIEAVSGATTGRESIGDAGGDAERQEPGATREPTRESAPAADTSFAAPDTQDTPVPPAKTEAPTVEDGPAARGPPAAGQTLTQAIADAGKLGVSGI
jgi:hypothetical protein